MRPWALIALLAACSRTAAPEPVVVTSTLALDFPGATAFALEASCQAGPECASSWLKKLPDGKELRAQVLVMPLTPSTSMPTIVERLQQSATDQGGTSDFFSQHGQQVGRMLLPQSEGREVAISYLLPSPDKQALHVLTSVVPTAQQVIADAALRDLLAFAAWTRPRSDPSDQTDVATPPR